MRRAAAGLEDQRTAIEKLSRQTAPNQPPIFTGMGSSYDACYPVVNELAARGISAAMLDAAELLHFRRRVVRPDATVVAVSQSGRSAEVVRLARELAPIAPLLVAVTNGSDNPLASLARVAIDTRAGEESGPSTMTFAASLVVLACLGAVLAGASVPDAIASAADAAATASAALDGLLADASLADRIEVWFGGREVAVVLGRGPARAAAEMGALTLKEAAGLPVESLQTGQFRHGPLELAGPGLAAIVIATEPETRELDLGLATELLDAGSAVMVIVRDGPAPDGAFTVEVGPVDRRLAPAVSILPAQLLAWRLALREGREPGSYVRASKVTTRE